MNVKYGPMEVPTLAADSTVYPRVTFMLDSKTYNTAAEAFSAEQADESDCIILRRGGKKYFIRKNSESKYQWSYDFTIKPGKNIINLSDIAGWVNLDKTAPTTDDFYGLAADGSNRHVEVRCLSYGENHKWGEDGAYVPNEAENELGIKDESLPCGYVSYSADDKTLRFSKWTTAECTYRIRYITKAFKKGA